MIAQVITRLFQSQTSGAAGSSVFGLVVLVWSALKLFGGLNTAFAEIYEVDVDSSFTDQLRDGLVVLVSFVFAAAAIIVATSAFSAYSERVPFLGVLLPVVVAIGLVVALFPMYYVFPNVDVSPREVLPGVVVAAVGWALLQGVFQIYVTLSSGGGTGLITGIMLLLTWLYFSGVVLLLGAVVNAVIEGYPAERVDIGETVRSPTYGISLEAESEAWTSQTCPECGDHEKTVRHGDTLTCPCGFEGHADLTASETFLRENSDCEIRPMARPVRFEWDDHDWSGKPHPHESPKEVRTNPQVASVGR